MPGRVGEAGKGGKGSGEGRKEKGKVRRRLGKGQGCERGHRREPSGPGYVGGDSLLLSGQVTIDLRQPKKAGEAGREGVCPACMENKV